MTIRASLTEKEYAQLQRQMKDFYRKRGERYVLDVEEDEAPELRRALESERQLKRQAEKREKLLQDDLRQAQFRSAVFEGALKGGVLVPAMEDVLNRAQSVNVPTESLNEWLDCLRDEAPHLFGE